MFASELSAKNKARRRTNWIIGPLARPARPIGEAASLPSRRCCCAAALPCPRLPAARTRACRQFGCVRFRPLGSQRHRLLACPHPACADRGGVLLSKDTSVSNSVMVRRQQRAPRRPFAVPRCAAQPGRQERGPCICCRAVSRSAPAPPRLPPALAAGGQGHRNAGGHRRDCGRRAAAPRCGRGAAALGQAFCDRGAGRGGRRGRGGNTARGEAGRHCAGAHCRPPAIPLGCGLQMVSFQFGTANHTFRVCGSSGKPLQPLRPAATAEQRRRACAGRAGSPGRTALPAHPPAPPTAAVDAEHRAVDIYTCTGVTLSWTTDGFKARAPPGWLAGCGPGAGCCCPGLPPQTASAPPKTQPPSVPAADVDHAKWQRRRHSSAQRGAQPRRRARRSCGRSSWQRHPDWPPAAGHQRERRALRPALVRQRHPPEGPVCSHVPTSAIHVHASARPHGGACLPPLTTAPNFAPAPPASACPFQKWRSAVCGAQVCVTCMHREARLLPDHPHGNPALQRHHFLHRHHL